MCLIALKSRRMWGYVGLWVVGLTGAGLSLLAGMAFKSIVLGFVGLVTLYWVLQIRADRSGWSRLK